MPTNRQTPRGFRRTLQASAGSIARIVADMDATGCQIVKRARLRSRLHSNLSSRAGGGSGMRCLRRCDKKIISLIAVMPLTPFVVTLLCIARLKGEKNQEMFGTGQQEIEDIENSGFHSGKTKNENTM